MGTHLTVILTSFSTLKMASSTDFTLYLPPILDHLVDRWLAEDIPTSDVGGFVVGNKPGSAVLYVKSPGVQAGAPFVDAVMTRLGVEMEWKRHDGDVVTAEELEAAGGKIVAGIALGPVARILQGERISLNVLARASGIATASAAFADLVEANGWGGTVAGTRKTTPGFRDVEKYAMLVGGVDSHRTNLSSMVMLKDNHIWATGSISAAVATARKAAGFSTKIEVETSTYEDAAEAITAGADVIMLDNFAPDDLKDVAARLKTDFADSPHKFLLEASGGIRLSTIEAFFCPDIDIISTSSLHQGVGVVDFSLKIDPSQ